jgi:hypothetical protein
MRLSRRRLVERRFPLEWWYVFDIPHEHCVRLELEHFLNALSLQVIRGNSVVMLEALERISDK